MCLFLNCDIRCSSSPRLSIFSSFANDKLSSENRSKSRPNGIAC